MKRVFAVVAIVCAGFVPAQALASSRHTTLTTAKAALVAQRVYSHSATSRCNRVRANIVDCLVVRVPTPYSAAILKIRVKRLHNQSLTTSVRARAYFAFNLHTGTWTNTPTEVGSV